MVFDQKVQLVFRVTRYASGKWSVTEAGFDTPLALFDKQNDALQYAEKLARIKSGSVVKLFDETGHEMPSQSLSEVSH